MQAGDSNRVRVPPLHFALLSGVFVASRALYYASGARFDDRDLDSMWHFVAPDLLRDRLLESVLHLHFQPPLFNLYLGVVLQVFGDHAHAAFATSFHLLGVGFACALLWLMRACGAGPRTAMLLSALMVASPALLLFESYLFYSYPVMVALAAAAASLHHAAQRRSAAAWAVAFGLLAGVVLTRALFHPAWLLAIALAALALRPLDRRQIAAGAAVPLLIVALFCGKNWVLFGTPSTSSWLGMGLARMTVRNLPQPLRERWIAQGQLSELSSVRPPGTLDEYARFVELPAPTGVAVLDQRVKPSGAINLHHLAYVEISRRLGSDAREVLRRRPDVYGRAALGALRRFLSPAADWHPLARNRERIAGYARAYAAVVHFPTLLGRSGLMLLLLPALTLFGAARAWRALRADRHDATGLTLGFMTSTIVFVTLAGCLLEPRENMRFRLLIEPFLWLLLALAFGRFARLQR